MVDPWAGEGGFDPDPEAYCPVRPASGADPCGSAAPEARVRAGLFAHDAREGLAPVAGAVPRTDRPMVEVAHGVLGECACVFRPSPARAP